MLCHDNYIDACTDIRNDLHADKDSDMIILIGAQKGGSGKSTTAVNVCAELANQDRDVVLVDADRQSTAANWVSYREENPVLPTVHCLQKYDNIRQTLLDLDKRYEFVVVDAAGRDSRELRTAMTAANIMIMPLRPSQPDLDTLPRMQEIIIEALDINPDLNVMGLLTMASTNPSVKEEQEALSFLDEYPEISSLKTIIRERKTYRDAMSSGTGVVEMNNPKAKREIKELVEEIL
jgi:chromosome partitioning protein